MREIEVVAIKDGTIEENLREMGFSSSICLRLRKKMGLIKVENVPIRIIDKVFKDQSIKIILEDKFKRKIEPNYNIDIKIVYEDEDLAVIDKPAGLTVIATKEHYGKSLENVLAAKWGDFVYRPVNRLDRDTSGLMIVAKNQFAHSELSKTHIERKYLALCEGVVEQSGVINEPIERKAGSIMERCVQENGKEAITLYRLKKVYSNYCLVELELKTGRTHQIRVHMAYIGHPLLGDSLYNPNFEENKVLDNGYVLKRQALHSTYLSFIHPVTKKQIILESKPDFIE